MSYQQWRQSFRTNFEETLLELLEVIIVKSPSSQMSRSHHLRKQRPGSQFVRMLIWFGSGLAIVFVMWTFVMVMLQALDQWKK